MTTLRSSQSNYSSNGYLPQAGRLKSIKWLEKLLRSRKQAAEEKKNRKINTPFRKSRDKESVRPINAFFFLAEDESS